MSHSVSLGVARLLALLFFLVLPSAVAAQSSPVVDVLLRARLALNDLRHQDADSLARFVISAFGSIISPQERMEALAISASALYPEPIEGVRQDPDGALRPLRELVRLDPEATLPQNFRWRGLDSLLSVARRSTFAGRVRPDSMVEFSLGRDSRIAQGMTTREARWRTELIPEGGQGESLTRFLDEPTTTPNLQLGVATRTGAPALQRGSYILRVTALDADSPDSIRWEYPVTVEAAELLLLEAPQAPTSAQILPEVARPARGKGILLGLVLGAITAVGIETLRGSSDLGTSAPADGTAMVAGLLIAAGTTIGGFIDKGAPLPANVAANVRRRQDYEAMQLHVDTENQRLLSAYRVTLTIAGGRQ